MKFYIQDVMYLIGESRRELPKIFLLFVAISLLDLLGLGIIGPFLGVVFGGVDRMPPQIIGVFSLQNLSHDYLVLFFAIIMMTVYAIKSISGALILRVVIAYSQEQQIRIRKNLITSYQNMPYHKMIQRNSSEFINAIQLMVPNYANLMMFVLQALGDSIVAVVIILFLVWTNPYAFALLALIIGVCLLGLIVLFVTVSRKLADTPMSRHLRLLV